MFPDLFNISNGSYTIMMIIGMISALILFYIYLKKMGFDKNSCIDLAITGIVAIIAGIIFSILFQNLYNFLESPSTYKWSWSMTFIGGVFGGVAGFLLMYFFYYKRQHSGCMDKILTIAPASITLAHFFGRIGCFLAGCCYGKESDAWYAIYFPILGKKVIPTQLYEAIFVLVLAIIFIIIAFKKKIFPYSMAIYMLAYGIFRFLIEFIRGDHRGNFIGPFSPSQFWCFFLIIGAIVLWILEKKILMKKEIKEEGLN